MKNELQAITALKEGLRALETYARREETIIERNLMRAAIYRMEEKYGFDAPYTFQASRKKVPVRASYIEELA